MRANSGRGGGRSTPSFPNRFRAARHRRTFNRRHRLRAGAFGSCGEIQTLAREAQIEAKGITGDVFALDDPFGSLITDIKSDDFKKLGYAVGDTVKFTIDGKPFAFPFVKTFASVPVGKPLLYVDSRGRLSVALNQRDFSKLYKITPPASIFVPRKPA